MPILGKVSPTTGQAAADVLLFQVGAGKQASVTVSATNRSAAEQAIRLAIVKDADLAIQSVPVTSAGSGYTSIPALTVTGSNTTPAVVAVGSMRLSAATVSTLGSGYAVGDILTLSGGTSTTTAKVRVESTNGSGGITSISVNTAGQYSVLPSGASALTGGSGSNGAVNTLQWGILTISVTNAGNGYAATPTITAAAQSGASGFVATAVMTTVVEVGDYFEFDLPVPAKNSFERSGIVLGPKEQLFVRAANIDAVNFFAWGYEEA